MAHFSREIERKQCSPLFQQSVQKANDDPHMLCDKKNCLKRPGVEGDMQA